MTSLREAIRRRLRRWTEKETPAEGPDLRLGYRLYWTKTALTWDPARRRQVLEAVRRRIQAQDFEPNPLQRRYRVPEVDGSAHAGLSLLALQEVLEAFERQEEHQPKE